MNPAVAEFVIWWSIVYVVSLVLLAVLSWFASDAALEGLAALDRWLYTAEHKSRPATDGLARDRVNTNDAPSL